MLPVPPTFAVVLPRGSSARFPERCVACGGWEPESSTSILSRNARAGRLLILGWFLVRVPCCRRCGWRLQLARAGNVVGTLIVGLGSIALAGFALSAWFQGAALGLLSLSVTMMCLGALVLWEMFHPPPFTVEVHGATVEYVFRDPSQAREFACLNGGVRVQYGHAAPSDRADMQRGVDRP